MLASVVLPVPGGPQNCAHVSARHQGRVSAQSSMGESGRRGGAARAPPRRAVHSDPRSGPGTERGRMSRARNEGPRRTLGRILSARVRGRPVSGGGGGGETEFCALRLEGGAPPSSSSSSASTSMGSIVCTQRASTSTTPHRAGGRGAAWRGTAPPPACRGTASSRARATNERSVEPCKNQRSAALPPPMQAPPRSGPPLRRTLLLGAPGVGKSTLTMRYIHDEFVQHHDPTSPCSRSLLSAGSSGLRGD